jgi:hypothetical protein
MARQQLQLELRLRTEYGENGEKNYVYSAVPLAVSFVPFRPENELIPVYLTGDITGGDLNSKTFMMYRADNNPKNHEYTYTGKFGANTHFKFCSEIALGDESKMFGNGGGNTLIIGGSDDIVIENEGIYTLTMNDKTLTYSVTPYTGAATEYDAVNFVGAFCGWGEGLADPEMQNFVVGKNGGGTLIDRHNWYLEIDLDNIEYGVKFRANHGWENRWCPVKSTDNPFGIAELNPVQDPNIDITQQGLGHYEVRFNDLTGHYFIKMRTL